MAVNKVDLFKLEVPAEKLRGVIPSSADTNRDGNLSYDEVWVDMDEWSKREMWLLGDKYLNCQPFNKEAVIADIGVKKAERQKVLGKVFEVFKEEHKNVDFSFSERDEYVKTNQPLNNLQNALLQNSSTGAMTTGLQFLHDGKIVTIRSSRPAERAGLSVGDVLTEIDGVKMNEDINISAVLIGKCGETIAVKAFRPITVESVDFTPNALGLQNFFGVGSVVGDYEVEITRQP